MSTVRSFVDRSNGGETIRFQNAGYLYASEGPVTLTNIFGNFLGTLTAFYDCPATWSRKIKKDPFPLTLQNVCLNILACSTFTFLNELVSEANIQSGFASRILYVVGRDEDVTGDAKFQQGRTDEQKEAYKKFREALTQDLVEISKMVGPMVAAPEMAPAWEAWIKKHKTFVRSLPSENLQSVLARTNTSVIKISMLLSAAESNERIIKLSHFEKAVELVEAVNKNVPGIFMRSRLAQAPGKGGANELARTILDFVQNKPHITDTIVKNAMIVKGFKTPDIDNVLKALLGSGSLKTGHCGAGVGTELIAHGNAHDYL
jgi:hypothetical protein